MIGIALLGTFLIDKQKVNDLVGLVTSGDSVDLCKEGERCYTSQTITIIVSKLSDVKSNKSVKKSYESTQITRREPRQRYPPTFLLQESINIEPPNRGKKNPVKDNIDFIDLSNTNAKPKRPRKTKIAPIIVKPVPKPLAKTSKQLPDPHTQKRPYHLLDTISKL